MKEGRKDLILSSWFSLDEVGYTIYLFLQQVSLNITLIFYSTQNSAHTREKRSLFFFQTESGAHTRGSMMASSSFH